MKKAILLLSSVIILGCFSEKDTVTEKPGKPSIESVLPEYQTIDSDSFLKDKYSANVRINSEIVENEIKAILNEYKIKHPGFNNYFIHFYLKDMTVGSGAWATANESENNLEISILGFSKSEAKKIEEQDFSNAVGAWRWDMMNVVMTLRKDNENYIMKLEYEDGSSNEEILVKGSKNNSITLSDPNNAFGEFYLLSDLGQLEIWDEDGKFDSAKTLKSPHF